MNNSFINVYAESNIGNNRNNNQDCFYCGGIYRKDIKIDNFSHKCVFRANENKTLSVFDGMGGSSKGELASFCAAFLLEEYDKSLKANEEFDVNYIINRMNRFICWKANEEGNKMGSTVVLLRYEDYKIQICNVGDSRAYVLRDNSLLQLSEDHTEENSFKKIQKELGVKYDFDKNKHNTLTQHLGIEDSECILEPYFSERLVIKEGDIFLLCSDGLTNMIEDKELERILGLNESVDNIGKILIDTALKNGGTDNITVLIMKYD